MLIKSLFREEDSALGNNSMKFWDFLDIFYFPKILSLFFLVWWSFQPIGENAVSCSANHEATRIYQVITNNHTVSHLW